MVKRDEAYELFGQGKTPKDPEVKDLGLAKETLRKYYGGWKKLPSEPLVEEVPVIAPPLVVPQEVQLSALALGAKFEFKGEKYRVADKIEDSVIVDKFREVTDEEGTTWLHSGHFTLHPSLIVKPIK